MVHGFGGWLDVLEAALTRQEAAGKEIRVQRLAKRYGDGGGGRDVGFRLLLLAAALWRRERFPPTQTSRRRMA